MTTVTRVSRHDAAARLQVSEATIDRMIKRGQLATEKEVQGSRYKVWVLMGDDTEDSHVSTPDLTGLHNGDKTVTTGLDTTEKAAATSEGSVYTDGDVIAVLRSERDGLRELVSHLQERLKDSEWRYQELLQQLNLSQQNMATLVKALPNADSGTVTQRRRWWPFRKS